MKTTNKFIIEFDKPPKLLFVSEDGSGYSGKDKIYIDGKELKGCRSVVIRSYFGEPTIHEVEFVTAVAGDNNGTD